jgi:hypothetical protein
MVDVYIGAREATAVSAPGPLRLKSPLVEYGGEHEAAAPSALLVNRP